MARRSRVSAFGVVLAAVVVAIGVPLVAGLAWLQVSQPFGTVETGDYAAGLFFGGAAVALALLYLFGALAARRRHSGSDAGVNPVPESDAFDRDTRRLSS